MTSIPKPTKRVKVTRTRLRKNRKSALAAGKRKLWEMFSAFVKERDGNACFSCGSSGLEGANWHAGHMFPAGGSSILRWHPLNVHSQCYRCNINLGGNGAEYASRFIEVYGIDQLMYLNEIKRQQMQWREPDIRELIEALKRGGADYELLYAEKIGSVLTAPIRPPFCPPIANSTNENEEGTNDR